jgi:hypothetical protein
MEIFKDKKEKYNFSDNLQPLFEAMEKGEVIREITLIDKCKEKLGENTILDFKATHYWVAMQSNGTNTESFDYVNVETNSKLKSFYMNWVVSFKI